MQPSRLDVSGVGRDALREQSQNSSTPSNVQSAFSRSVSDSRRFRTEESWVEISSQPSSSSLSSVATDEIVTTGLRVQRESRRLGRVNQSGPSHLSMETRQNSASDSQEEYEESESESDKAMASSNEAVQGPTFGTDLSPSQHHPYSSASEDASSDEEADDDDENSTALGLVRNEPMFTPQPNAFSHPPSRASWPPQQLQSVPGSYFPRQISSSRQTGTTHRQTSNSSVPGQISQHSPYNVISPSYAADHDAALRASLSTLLSCAAAARGLPKSQCPSVTPGPSGRPDPTSLRMVPESVVMGEEAEVEPAMESRPNPSDGPVKSDRPGPKGGEKGKRRASTSRDRRAIKKTRNARVMSTEEMISPTLLTWVVSAGVVVLVSAISFSAGYAMGREVGHVEASTPAGDGLACGREAVRGSLRRFRWGSGARSWISGGQGSVMV